jgi:PD-(D/E)XK endonuclease
MRVRAGSDEAETGFIPWIMAVAEEPESWAESPNRNLKKLGEIAEAAFLAKAAGLGLGIAKPWGDSERFDFIVWTGRGGRMRRVQVKSSGRLHGRGYVVKPVYGLQGKAEYTAEDIDVLAAYVRGRDVWYVLPVKEFAPARSLRFYPDVEWEGARWEQWRENWRVLGAGRRR